jgi:hypothetical protein
MTIKDKLDKDMVDYQNFINSFMNELIEDIYLELVKFETNEEYCYINNNNLKTIIKNNNINNSLINYIRISIVDYSQLNSKHINLNNYLNFNINGILGNSVLETNNKNNPPFVILTIQKNIIEKYNSNELDFENAYSNIEIKFNLNDKHNLKLFKYKTATNIYVILFFDSLTYNETFIYENDKCANQIDEKYYIDEMKNNVVNDKQKITDKTKIIHYDIQKCLLFECVNEIKKLNGTDEQIEKQNCLIETLLLNINSLFLKNDENVNKIDEIIMDIDCLKEDVKKIKNRG